MNKKIFKRLLIATTMLSPIAIVTPMILTSCNDSQSDGNTSEYDITVGNLNSLLKKRKDENNNEYFWLDVVDFHGGSFNGFNQIKGFYDGLVKNKITLINSLIDKQKFKFNPTSSNVENNGKPTDYFANELTLTKNTYTASDDVENLTTTFKGLFLSNVLNNDGEDNLSVDKGVIIKGEDLNFTKLLSSTNINSKITFIDQKTEANDNTTIAIRKKNRYQISYNIQPKDKYGWKGMSGVDRQLPLVITLSDYVTDISVIDELNKIYVTNNATTKVDEIILNVSATSTDTRDNVVNILKEQIGIDLTNNIDGGTADDHPITKINELFTLLSNPEYKVKIEGDDKSNTSNKIDVTENFLSKKDIINNDLIKNRLKFYVKNGKKDETNDKLITIEAAIEIKKDSNNLSDYNWFGGDVANKNQNAPIIMKFNIITN